VRFDTASDAQKEAFKSFWLGLSAARTVQAGELNFEVEESTDADFADFLDAVGEERIYICSGIDSGDTCGGLYFSVYLDPDGTQPEVLMLCEREPAPDPCETIIPGPQPFTPIGAEPMWWGCQPPDTKEMIFVECGATNPRTAPRSSSDPPCKWCTGDSGG